MNQISVTAMCNAQFGLTHRFYSKVRLLCKGMQNAINKQPSKYNFTSPMKSYCVLKFSLPPNSLKAPWRFKCPSLVNGGTMVLWQLPQYVDRTRIFQSQCIKCQSLHLSKFLFSWPLSKEFVIEPSNLLEGSWSADWRRDFTQPVHLLHIKA